MPDLGAVEAARKIVAVMAYPRGAATIGEYEAQCRVLESQAAKIIEDSTCQVVLREQNAELVAAWEVFYQGLPDGEYAGLGEMRSAMRAIGWDMTAAEKRKRQ